MASPSPSASPSGQSILASVPSPLRTISMAKAVWEQETALLQKFPSRSPSRSPSVHILTPPGPTEAGEASISSEARLEQDWQDRSIFGLPLLSCCTRWYRLWSMWILILDLTYSAFLLPISVGFLVNDLEWTWACIVDLVAGVFFAAELVLGFHVTFVVRTGGRRREVMDGRHVALYYMRHGSFAQDLLSTLIWVVQHHAEHIQHDFGIRNFIAIKEGFENTWLNPVAQLVRHYSHDGVSLLTPEEAAAIPGPRRWLTGFYFTLVTMATLGYGDIVPSTAVETGVDCFIIAFGVLMFGIVMGSIAEQVANSSREAQQAQIYREKMNTVRGWLRASSMPKNLKNKITDYYSDVWVKHAQVADATQLFFELPHKLRQEIAWELNKAIFEQLPFLENVNEAVRFMLCSFMAPVELGPGQELCLRGELADRFWVLHDGEVQVINSYDTLRSIQAPAVLGESAVLQHIDDNYCVRPHGYRTESGCSLWEVPLRDLMPLLVAHPDVLDALTTNAKARLSRESILSVAALNEDGFCFGTGSVAGIWGSQNDKSGKWQQLGGVEVVSCQSEEGKGTGDQAAEGEVFALPLGIAATHTSQVTPRHVLSAVSEGISSAGTEHTLTEFPAAGSAVTVVAKGAKHDDRGQPTSEDGGARPEGTVGPDGVEGTAQASIEGPQASLVQAAAASTFFLTADGRSAAQLPSPFEAPAAAVPGAGEGPVMEAADGAEDADAAGPVTRGELAKAMDSLLHGLAGRLDDLSQELHKASRAAHMQASLPLWSSTTAGERRRGRLSIDKTSGRSRSPSPSGATPRAAGMKWGFGQY
ncbi:hypothetical protein N2152v2_000553 [Parachlorella kessleri]